MTHAEKEIRNEQMRTYKAEGHSMDEVAERFGVSKGLAQGVCKGIAPQTLRKCKTYRNQYSDEGYCLKLIAKMVEERAQGFVFVGNYTGSDGFAQLRCKSCGTVTTKSCVSIRHGTARCDVCYKAELAEKKAKEKEAREKKRERKRFARYEESIKQESFGVCCECGNLFVKPFDGAVCCSTKCTRRHENNKKDRRLVGVEQDRGITLSRVYDRDHGVCHLCGTQCDWSDYETRGGVVICGNNYPSIDHVIPLAKRGTHTWSNVRLAHRWCNAVKSDTPLN